MKKIIPFLFFLASCHIGVKKEPIIIKETVETTTISLPSVSIVKLEEKDYPIFKDTGDMKKFFKAAALNMTYLKDNSGKKTLYSFENRKITNELLLKTTEKLFEILSSSTENINDINDKIKENFEIYELKPSTNQVIFSSYYEPLLEASLVKTSEYKYPIYRKPPDLIEVNLEDFNEKYRGEKITGRIEGNKLVPYFSRDEIDYQKVLEGKGLELAWFKSMADVMDLHIEGSGILKLPDGKFVKAKYAATNSLKFKGWMTALLEMGFMKKEELTPKKAKEFIDKNPDLHRAILGQNKRYTFFKLEEIKDPEEGPTGTYGYPLVGGRSIAVDRTIIPMGMPAFMVVNLPDVGKNGEFYGLKPDSRFVFCQDTGGAIKGARVDFFAGSGVQAKTLAFSLWEKGRLFLLLAKESGDKI